MPEQRQGPPRDAPITVALLVAAVVTVTRAVAAARMLPASLDESYASAGLGHYTNVALATPVGSAVVITQIVSLVIAIAVSVQRLRRGRRSFWVPLVVAAGCWLVTGALYTVAILGDPAFAKAMTAVS